MRAVWIILFLLGTTTAFGEEPAEISRTLGTFTQENLESEIVFSFDWGAAQLVQSLRPKFTQATAAKLKCTDSTEPSQQVCWFSLDSSFNLTTTPAAPLASAIEHLGGDGELDSLSVGNAGHFIEIQIKEEDAQSLLKQLGLTAPTVESGSKRFGDLECEEVLMRPMSRAGLRGILVRSLRCTIRLPLQP